MLKKNTRLIIIVCAVAMIIALSAAIRCVDLLSATDIFGGIANGLLALAFAGVCLYCYSLYRKTGAEIQDQKRQQQRQKHDNQDSDEVDVDSLEGWN